MARNTLESNLNMAPPYPEYWAASTGVRSGRRQDTETVLLGSVCEPEVIGHDRVEDAGGGEPQRGPEMDRVERRDDCRIEG